MLGMLTRLAVILLPLLWLGLALIVLAACRMASLAEASR
jgi:hypothetical protein